MPWSDSPLRTLTLPQDAATGAPRIVIGPDVPAALAVYKINGFDTMWSAAILWYFNATDFYFIASGRVSIPGPPPDIDIVAKGTYRSALEGIAIQELLSADGIAGNRYGDPNTFLTFSYQNCEIAVASDSTIRFDGIGLQIAQNAIDAGDPTSLVDAVETWHPLPFNAALGVPWTNGGGAAVPGQYKLLASPARSVFLAGELAAGTRVDNTIVATLPVGYRPAHNITIPCAMNPSTPGSTTPLLQLQTDGTLRCFGMAAAAGPRVYFSWIGPLDA